MITAIKIGRYTHEKRTQDIREVRNIQPKQSQVQSPTAANNANTQVWAVKIRHLKLLRYFLETHCYVKIWLFRKVIVVSSLKDGLLLCIPLPALRALSPC